jgi:hypothetical protein
MDINGSPAILIFGSRIPMKIGINKKAVNRPKDQVDVIELERIQKILGGAGNISI